MARFGIRGGEMLGISVATLRGMARSIGRNQRLAEQLWATGIHEARILATIVTDPTQVTSRQLDLWLKDLDSWDVTDGFAANLVAATPYAWRKARSWAKRRAEFEKRAGFALMADLAVHDKAADDDAFLALLPLVRAASGDDRPYVKKAVNWALRQIGKRNRPLNRAAIACAEEIYGTNTRSGRWIAADALRELRDPKVQARLREH
jgi:3-methyladenine DNA glycosylase AlkD